MKLKATIFGIFLAVSAMAQEIPNANQNVFSLSTFSIDASDKWGDDDHKQVYFIEVPMTQKTGFYIRIWDPEIGGANDQRVAGDFNSQSKFSVIGGIGVFNLEDKMSENSIGTLLGSKTFSMSTKLDDNWYALGPFFPQQGEKNVDGTHAIFKVLCEGISGDDGNLYRYYISTEKNQNISVKNSILYTFESTVRLLHKGKQAHFYPFIDESVQSIKQCNFDMDKDVDIRIFSIDKMGVPASTSENANWNFSKHNVTKTERMNCWDVRYIDRTASGENDATVYFVNQYDEAVKQFNSPVGNIKFKYKFSFDVK